MLILDGGMVGNDFFSSKMDKNKVLDHSPPPKMDIYLYKRAKYGHFGFTELHYSQNIGENMDFCI